MKEEHKKRLCELAGFSEKFIQPAAWVDYELEIFIKAMWAINDDENNPYSIEMSVKNMFAVGKKDRKYTVEILEFWDLPNKQEALTKALEYVLDKETI